MTDLFTRCRYIPYCIIQQSHLGQYNNGKLCTATLINDETLRSVADFASPLISVNNVKISDLLAFLLMLLFSSLSSHLKIIGSGGIHF